MGRCGIREAITHRVNKLLCLCLSVSVLSLKIRYLSSFLDQIRLLGFTTLYTTRDATQSSAMPGPLTPRHKGTVYWR